MRAINYQCDRCKCVDLATKLGPNTVVAPKDWSHEAGRDLCKACTISFEDFMAGRSDFRTLQEKASVDSHIAVVVEGGCLQSIYSSRAASVELIDFDDLGAEVGQLRALAAANRLPFGIF